ncbi:MAG: hypothetical protein JKY53_02125 [Flavobacteriales bacterium]|nr:hypothetical protein [Flavobacteriales bacterium]
MQKHFPVYRKYTNNKVFFKILSFREFEELTIGASGVSRQVIKAKIHPDRVRIQDMLSNHGGYWVESSEDEWNQVSQ